jgi:biotin carboxyl carrier protein
MKIQGKIGGKKFDWENPGSEILKEWNFEKRPGGWVIGTRTVGGRITERTRFFYSRTRHNFFAKLTDGKSLSVHGERVPLTRGSASGASAAQDYTAQFPGKVRKIAVSEGAEVTAGTPLLMVEAMKMEFAIKAGTDGTVKKILVTEGATLTPGQKLLDFEEKK